MTTFNTNLKNLFTSERNARGKSMRGMAEFLEIPYTSYRLLERNGDIPMKYFDRIMEKVGYTINLVPIEILTSGGEVEEKKEGGFMSTILEKFFNKK